MTIYRVSYAEAQAVYDELRELAGTVREQVANLPKHEPLSPADFIKFESGRRKGFQYKISVDGAPPRAFGGTVIWTRVYEELCRHDQNADGRIDAAFVRENVVVDDAAPVEEISPELRQDLIRLYADSVFDITPVYEVEDGSNKAVTGKAVVISATELDDGKWEYVAVAALDGMETNSRHETEFRLDAVSGNYAFTKGVAIKAVDGEGLMGYLTWTSDVALRAIPLLPESQTPALGSPVLTLGNQYDSGRFIDKEIGYTGRDDHYPFALSRIETALTASSPSDLRRGEPVLSPGGFLLGITFDWDDDPTRFRYVIPANRIHKSLQNVTEHADEKTAAYADWGIFVDALSFEDARRDALPEALQKNGVLVAKVVPGGAADVAEPKIKSGDIIFAVGSEKSITAIDNDLQLYKFLTALRESRPGDPLKIKVYRPTTGEFVTSRLVPTALAFGTPRAYETKYGFNVHDMPARDRIRHRIADNVSGVFVTKRGMGAYSWGEIAPGLSHGMIITAVNEVAIYDVATFQAEFESAVKTDKPVMLTTYATGFAADEASGGPGAVGFAVIKP